MSMLKTTHVLKHCGNSDLFVGVDMSSNDVDKIVKTEHANCARV